MSVLSGSWHNEHGSELTIEVAPTGRVVGHFRTGVGLGKEESFDVVGCAADELIAFTVCFGRRGAITSWVGHFLAAEQRIEALWHMTVAMPHPGRADELWKGVWSGADVFERGPAEAVRPPSRRPAPTPLWMG